MEKTRINHLTDYMSKNGSPAAAFRNKNKNADYKCIFFDLDHTLWDYEFNARATLLELHEEYDLSGRGIPFDEFHKHFTTVNVHLWDLYDRGLIDNEVIRTQRFTRVLEQFKVKEDKLSATLSYEYLHGCPKKANLLPYAKDVLEYLSRNYSLTVITNGFEEIQSVKLLSGNITHYFNHVITSQKAGYKKPAREIFDYALSLNKLQCHQVMMVGDNLVTDIGGARNACIDAVFYNPGGVTHNEEVSYEIRCLSELQNIL